MAQILIVEDEELVRELARRVCNWANHNVTTVATAREALERVTSQAWGPFDLLLTDYQIGSETAFGLVVTMMGVAEKPLPKRILVMSADFPPAIDDWLMSLRQDGFVAEKIHKPFLVEEMRGLIDSMLRVKPEVS